jgi:small subunit ribosomal protein S1
VLQPGDDVEVYVLNVDRPRRRVGLSLKRLRPDPWDTVDARYDVGQVVEGTITNVVNFGAFVRLETGLEGLIHSSDWGDPTPLEPHCTGKVVRVRVVNVERERRRMSLRLEALIDEKPS